mmetsp:Transcript_4728/g.14610  ORF Transcript_4728/g.14610 Transcript_4728/m.14610 type:complete len:248 (+) Transcript_4728:307-1050(+)
MVLLRHGARRRRRRSGDELAESADGRRRDVLVLLLWRRPRPHGRDGAKGGVHVDRPRDELQRAQLGPRRGRARERRDPHAERRPGRLRRRLRRLAAGGDAPSGGLRFVLPHDRCTHRQLRRRGRARYGRGQIQQGWAHLERRPTRLLRRARRGRAACDRGEAAGWRAAAALLDGVRGDRRRWHALDRPRAERRRTRVDEERRWAHLRAERRARRVGRRCGRAAKPRAARRRPLPPLLLRAERQGRGI